MEAKGLETELSIPCSGKGLGQSSIPEARRAATGAAISTELAWLVEVWNGLPEAVREEVLDVARLAVAADVSVE